MIHSDIDELRKGFRKLRLSSIFLDAGSGDGRVVALAASMGLNAVGIEQDKHLFERSKSILKKYRAKLINGDFSKDITYQKAGINFQDISTIFNFYDNHWLIAEKIIRQSKPGTRFLLLSPSLPRPFQGLEHVNTVELGTFPKLWLYEYRK